MASRPFLKFYTSDWRSDPRLRICGLAARGLWLEMLAIMHEAKPRGYLSVAGTGLNTKTLSALVGIPEEDVCRALAELGKAGVFSRTKAGLIYSRKMVRDEEKSRKSREFGKMGGNPSLCNDKEKSGRVKGQDIPHIPDTIFQKPDKYLPIANAIGASAPCDLGNFPMDKQAPNGDDLLPFAEMVNHATGVAEAQEPDMTSKIIWDAGRRFLISSTGKREDQIRKVLGQWVKKHGPGSVLKAVTTAQENNAIDPISYIVKMLDVNSKIKHGTYGTFN